MFLTFIYSRHLSPNYKPQGCKDVVFQVSLFFSLELVNLWIPDFGILTNTKREVKIEESDENENAHPEFCI